ncbi:MAG: hypothetical protein Fur0016_16460 [Anaerolineales bacterium]
MLTSPIFKQRVAFRANDSDFCEINRVLAAAVVSQKFCALLLSDPARAVAQGYAGEQFFLSDVEYDLALSARGCSLQEFAQQIGETLASRPVFAIQPANSGSIEAQMPAF